MRRCFRLLLLALLLSLTAPLTAGPPQRDWEPVELVGHAHDWWYKRYFRFYHWSEDFAFILKEEGGKNWRIISREPTPAYDWRMGTTFTGLEVDWKKNPRVKVAGVKAVDRIPATFHDFKLDEPNLATALILWVETKPGEWKEFWVNNWFHKWGPRADPKIHSYYAGKGLPYQVFGYARSQAAPFDKKSQGIIDQHKDNPSLMFHGRVKTSKEQPFGYELELIDLVGRNVKSGGATLLHGDGKGIPKLDKTKP